MDRIYRIKQGNGGRPAIERDGQLHWLKGELFGAYQLGDSVPAGSHRFLAPVMPSIVVCIGLNYKDHAAEMNKKLPAEPLVLEDGSPLAESERRFHSAFTHASTKKVHGLADDDGALNYRYAWMEK